MEKDKYTDMAVNIQRVESLAKSNEHRLDEHSEELKNIRAKQDAIYDLTSSVKSIAQDMSNVRDDVSELKVKQETFGNELTELKYRPFVRSKKLFDSILEKVIWVVVGGGLVGILTYLFPNIKW